MTVLLACVLALDSADSAAVGAVAGPLEKAFTLSHAELGVLASLPSLAAAAATLPVGALTDRVNRVRLLAASVLLWAAATAVSGLAQTFIMLVFARVALGAVAVTSGPTLASLVGDYFGDHERGHVYGSILTGELVGAGLGFVAAGEAASAFSWRAAFFLLTIPSLALAPALYRLLPEPARGTAGRFSSPPRRVRTCHGDDGPRPDVVLSGDLRRMSVWQATRYALSIRSNLILIISSALGYYYFQDVQTFGLVFFQRHFRLSHATATVVVLALGLGGLVGVQVGGRLADRLHGGGRLRGRILVGGFGYLLAAAAFAPALVLPTVAVAMPLFVLAAIAFAARNPPLDAARLDIVPSLLWGRAEAVRTLLRRAAVAVAPISFGVVADALGAARSAPPGYPATASGHGLEYAFLVVLAVLVAGGLLTFRALPSYPRDMAAAAASERRTRGVREPAGVPEPAGSL